MSHQGIVLPIGNAIRHVRRVRNLSQRGLATELGVSASRVARLETDPGRMPLGDLLEVLVRLRFGLALSHVRPCESPGPTDNAGAGALHRQCLDWQVDGEVALRDAAGRAFPAHGVHEWTTFGGLPTNWGVRHGGWANAPGAAWLWHHTLEF